MSDVGRELLRRTVAGTYEHDRLIRDALAAIRSGIRDAADGLWGSTPPSEVVDRAIRTAVEDALPSRDGTLAAIRAGVADGAERALRPERHPLIGRRVTREDWAGRSGVVESVRDEVVVVRFDDGTAYANGTATVVLLPEATP